ncbi:MAG: hypothetical protein P4M08_13900 [Oligoflexia bacterium]|nr:hypothetical protein [Oligoflexia bacterium]
MKFSSTVDALSRENGNLKRLAILQAAGTLALGILALLLYDKPTVVIERSTRGLEIVSTTSLKRTEDDVKQAMVLMLKARLDANTIAPEVFLSERQMELRNEEQRELKSRGIEQSILVRTLNSDNGRATAEIDRVVRVGDIRSAVKTKLALAFQEVAPNELNPYGLRLATLTPIDSEIKPDQSAGVDPVSRPIQSPGTSTR